jgi:methylated-DNA-[protein]-cysteine S-methyltransferase
LLQNCSVLTTQREPQAAITSPIGLVKIFTTGTAVTGLEIAAGGSALPAKNPVAAQAADELSSYFAGDLKKFKVKLQLEGTEFQKAVWQQLAKIGFGQHLSYKDIAVAIGKPAAARAVGAAVGANPVPLILGCHRVLGSGSKITGYSGGEGLPTKAWLLNHEQISFRAL